MRFFIIVTFFVVALTAVNTPILVHAVAQTTYTPSTGIPGSEFDAGKNVTINGSSIAKFVAALYKFGWPLVGVMAVIVIITAGFIRIVAGGDSSRVEMSGEMLWAGITGLGIVLGAWVLLNTINPDLVSLKSLKITEIESKGKGKVVEVELSESEGEGQVDPGKPYSRPTGIVANGQPVATMNGISAVKGNDREGLPAGIIRRSDGQLVSLDPHLNATLKALQDAGIPVTLTSVVGNHSEHVAGTNRVSRHWDGAAFDGTNDERVTRYIFEHRVELGVQQIITANYPQYNISGGQPFTYSAGTLNSHRNHTHYGY